MKKHLTLLTIALCAPFILSAQGAKNQQGHKRLTSEDYSRAERLMDRELNELVLNRINSSGWTKDNRFWYNTNIPKGHRFVIVDPQKGTRESLFDHEQLAQALSEKEEKDFKPFDLPFQRIRFSDDGRRILFDSYSYHLETGELEKSENP